MMQVSENWSSRGAVEVWTLITLHYITLHFCSWKSFFFSTWYVIFFYLVCNKHNRIPSRNKSTTVHVTMFPSAPAWQHMGPFNTGPHYAITIAGHEEVQQG